MARVLLEEVGAAGPGWEKRSQRPVVATDHDIHQAIVLTKDVNLRVEQVPLWRQVAGRLLTLRVGEQPEGVRGGVVEVRNGLCLGLTSKMDGMSRGMHCDCIYAMGAYRRGEVESSGRHLLSRGLDGDGRCAEGHAQKRREGTAQRMAGHPDVRIGV